VNFDLASCNFTEENMHCRDRNGDGREGSSRVAFYLVNGLSRCYTLECTYNMGAVVNAVPAAPDLPADAITDPASSRYENGPPLFDLDILHDIGRAV
jgi:hypothetical protein